MKKDSKYKITTRKKLILLLVLMLPLTVAWAQEIGDEGIPGVEHDQIEVIFAVDGYLGGSNGEEKYFLLGVVRLHKPGVPETEWTIPFFYFELDGKAVLTGTTSYYYHSERGKDGTLEILPLLRELRSISGGFEMDFVFNRNGEIDVEQSKVGIIPEEYLAGRYVTRLVETGEYYKKGSKTERFVPQRDAEGKITNMDEAGEAILEERSVLINDVCLEYQDSDEGKSLYQSTGLCPVYRIQSISRSAGLPNAKELGLISTDPVKLPTPQKPEAKVTETNQSFITNETVILPTKPSINTTNKSLSAKEEELQEGNESGVVNPSGPTPTAPPAPPSNKSAS